LSVSVRIQLNEKKYSTLNKSDPFFKVPSFF
jgi:hypothetical protein